MKNLKFKIDGHYEVFFNDHSFGLATPFLCKVSGYVIEDHKKYVKLSVWVCLADDIDVRNSNHEPVCILKSTIVRRRAIKQRAKG